MKSMITIFSLLFSFISWAEISNEDYEKPPITLMKNEFEVWECKYYKKKEDISQCDELGKKIEVSSCEDYIKYSLNGYTVRNRIYVAQITQSLKDKRNYLDCFFTYKQDVSANSTEIGELNQIAKMIYNNTLSVQALEGIREKTPKELFLKKDGSNPHIYGFLKDVELDEDNVYIDISVKKKISDNTYLVWVYIDYLLGTSASLNQYIFNTKTKKYEILPSTDHLAG